MSQKPGDDTAVPLCWDHHTGPAGVHRVGERAFWPAHGIDPLAVAERMWARWSAQSAGTRSSTL